jgi:hypothetical protein
MSERPRFDFRAITPQDSPKTAEDVFGDPQVRDLATPKLAPGDAAFDFRLPLFDFSDGTPRETGETFHLAALACERPVALIFGSYT